MMLRLEALSKRFGSTVAVDDLSLEIGRGEFVSLLGPSGCGKTTTLRMIAGFETPTSGRIIAQDRDVTGIPPQRRGFGMVFQSYALFPHLNVYENVAFGLKAQGTPSGEIRQKVLEALERVDLTGYQDRNIQELSGGQQQRVALARALAPQPPLLLLDEPLSNLDAALRERTRDELRSLLKRVGITSIFVTHDQEEAFALSDRIAVLQGGRLQQVGTPEELYRSPANVFVASFVGRANFLDGTLLEAAAGGAGDGVVEVRGVRWPARTHGVSGGPVRVMARSEALMLVSRNGGAASEESASGVDLPSGDAAGSIGTGLPGTVVDRRFAGHLTFYRVALDGGGELFVAAPGVGAAFDGEVTVTVAPGEMVHAYPPA